MSFSPRAVLRKFLPGFQLRLAVVAMAALLFAQLGAMSHAYSHDAARSASHRTAVNSHDLCNDCLAYAPLLSAAGAPGTLPLLQPPGRGPVTSTTLGSQVELSPIPAFRSRAPPFTR
jgi:hypothetical protein